jgi:hypothetical protein
VLAVAVNIKAWGASVPGTVAAYQSDTQAPATVNLSFPAQRIVAGMSIVTAANGQIALAATTPTYLAVEVQGYFTTPEAAGAKGRFVPVPPTRILDTRRTGGVLRPGSRRLISVVGQARVPATGVSAVLLNIISVAPARAGRLTVSPARYPHAFSTLEFAARETRANRVIVAVGSDGRIGIADSGGGTYLLVEISGWFDNGSNPAVNSVGGYFKPLESGNLSDTRLAQPVINTKECMPVCGGPLKANGAVSFDFGGFRELPAPSSVLKLIAVVGTLSVTTTTGSGGAIAYASGTARPLASDVPYTRGTAPSNTVVSMVSATGRLVARPLTAAADVLFDLSGYFVRNAPATVANGVWGWGNNYYGIGRSDVIHSMSAVSLPSLTSVKSLSVSRSLSSLAVKTDGTVWAWGYTAAGVGASWSNEPVQIDGITTAVTAISGDYQGPFSQSSSYVLLQDGTVVAWGKNDRGQLGSDAPDLPAAPVAVGGLTNVTKLAANRQAAYALRSDGTVWAWGDNTSGQLADGTTTGFSAAPKQVAGLANVVSISADLDEAWAVTSAGAVYRWGANPWQAPTAVTSPESVTTCAAKDVVANYAGKAVLCTDGTVRIDYLHVVTDDPAAATGVTQIAASSDNFYLLDGAGTLWAAGQNHYGGLGTGWIMYPANRSWNPAAPVPGMRHVKTFGVDYASVHALVAN